MSDKKNILVIEDNKEMCWELENIFENEGYNVWTVTTGEEALKKIEENDIDLIVMDYKLPDMSGERILKFLQAADVKINMIVISAYGTSQMKRKILALGAAIFIDKPFKISELTKIAQALLENQ